MTEALLFVGAGALVVFGSLTLFVVILILRIARKYVELAEVRVELLREGQAHLLKLLSEQRSGGAESEREDQERLAEQLERERRARREAERRIGAIRQELRDFEKESEKVRRERPVPVAAGLTEARTETRGHAEERPPSTRKGGDTDKTPPASTGKTPPASFLETASRKPSRGSQEETGSRLGVWHPHPDDATPRPAPPAKRARVRDVAQGSGTQVEMFRKHYDKYLENYEGYVEMVEDLYRTRENSKVASGSPAEREWNERLRRLDDGIKRTTARLDVLEGCNPGLAADERVSRRASVARRYASVRDGAQPRQ